MKNMVYGLTQIKEPSQMCEECCKVKQARRSFKHNLSMKSRQKMELVHCDVCGSFEVMSNGGNYYFQIDEFTRHVWTHLIERKSNVFMQFKRFKLHVEK